MRPIKRKNDDFVINVVVSDSLSGISIKNNTK